MTTLEFFKWFIDEHPLVFVLTAFAIGGLGRIGSTRNETKVKLAKKTDA